MQEPRQYDAYGNLKINGQEWYDRFEGELQKFNGTEIERRGVYMCMIDAAKKAAGLK